MFRSGVRSRGCSATSRDVCCAPWRGWVDAGIRHLRSRVLLNEMTGLSRPWDGRDVEGRALTVTSIVRSHDERDLAVCEWGQADGSPVFWLHGTPGSRYLRHVGDGHIHAGLRVITYDRPGYGQSTRAPGRSVADVAADVVAIADALELRRFGVAGVSGGGPHALAVAALAPNRVTRCAAIVTTAPPDADGLDWFAGIDDEDRAFHQRVAAEGEPFLHNDFSEVVSWVESGMPDLDPLPKADHHMLVDTFREAI